ncbi:ATP-binding protein [Rhizobium sp. S152]|uniref:AlbA family DNA-binding domain-containing protein n=1 Tax=Rhizobium sp. S152 TaxID=3055038 RepID=UPI0025A96106|nr:ATP-binding protein [Rhizobium sp. S152]MDM9629593.1 ATP-binding protein [Rhizobium sp. S152]
MRFEELIAGAEAAIQGLIGKQETLQLEFKANDHRDPIFHDGILTKSGRRMLAKEASAFANSAGGVIVFGVDCRTANGVDQAERLTPISSIMRAETSVRDAAAELLQPRHDGIRVATISTTEDQTSGFVIVDVPRSDRRPHRAEAVDQKQYFKRAGSRSYPMEHFDIEDAFRRSASPSLSLKIAIKRYMTMHPQADYHLQLALANDGEVSAKSVTMQLWDRRGGVFGHDSYAPVRNHVTEFEARQYIAAPSDFVVHPGETRRFHHFVFRMSNGADGVRLGNVPLSDAVAGFKYAIGAENMRIEDREIDLLGAISVEAEDFFGVGGE